MQKTHQVPWVRMSLQDSSSPVATESDSSAIYPFFQPINLVHLSTKQSTDEKIEPTCDDQIVSLCYLDGKDRMFKMCSHWKWIFKQNASSSF